ncbi:MAG: SseB family protein [Pseudonocardiaceae bacterium]
MTEIGSVDGMELLPLVLPRDDSVLEELRAVVRSHRRHLRAAFVYHRRPLDHDELTPAVGLLAGAIQPPDPYLIARHVTDRVGTIYGQVPAVVLLDRRTLPDVLEVAAPIGAGGRLEDAVATARHGGIEEMMALTATVVDSVLTVATPATASSTIRALRPGDTPELPVLTDDDGRRLVPAFSSDLALLHTRPPVQGALRLPGAVLALILPRGTDVLLDPGTPNPAVIDARMLRGLAGVGTRCAKGRTDHTGARRPSQPW